MIAVSVVVLLAAGGTGVWLHGRHGPDGPAHNVKQVAAGSTQAAPAGESSAPAVTDPSGSASGPSGAAPTPTAAGGAVAVSSSVADNPDATSVTEFLAQYFSAINAHDYQAYVTLLGSQAQQGFTESQFENGYGSTTDSAETLTGISTAANGDTEAAVTFTSQQNASQSVDQSDNCTDWDISLFLENDGTSYLIDAPPPGYHAAHSSCS